MMATTLPRPVLPVWARPPIDAEGDRAPGLDTIAPGQMNGGTRGDRLRADLLPQVLACRDALAGLMTTPASRRLLARTDLLIREVSDPSWSPGSLDNALTELTDLLDRLRVLMAACAVAPHFAKRIAEVQWFASVRTRLLTKRLLDDLARRSKRPRTSRALASSLSRSGPPLPRPTTAASMATQHGAVTMT